MKKVCRFAVVLLCTTVTTVFGWALLDSNRALSGSGCHEFCDDVGCPDTGTRVCLAILCEGDGSKPGDYTYCMDGYLPE